jgi:Ring finger domain
MQELQYATERIVRTNSRDWPPRFLVPPFRDLTIFLRYSLSFCRNQCVNCQTVFGEYHCNICNLWMSMSKKPFHCALCGLCRVGGIEAFRHCNQCCMCISVAVFATHQCIPDKYKNACPVCVEDMFSSRQSPQDLPCGHAIHAHCFRKLAGFDYRCPLCKKTVVSQESMAAAWDARRREIEEHPMPAELILCALIANRKTLVVSGIFWVFNARNAARSTRWSNRSWPQGRTLKMQRTITVGQHDIDSKSRQIYIRLVTSDILYHVS